MQTNPGEPKSGWLETLAVIARWLAGLLFIYMGMNKALHPVEFLKLVRQYEMVDTPFLLNSIAAALPWFEVFCGLCLLLGVAVRGTALMMALMLIPFTALVIKRALGIATAKQIAFCAVKFDCGCGMGEVYICHKIVENSVLLLLSLWLISGRGRPLSLRFDLLRPKAISAQSPDAQPAQV